MFGLVQVTAVAVPTPLVQTPLVTHGLLSLHPVPLFLFPTPQTPPTHGACCHVLVSHGHVFGVVQMTQPKVNVLPQTSLLVMSF